MSDQAPEFSGKVIAALCDLLGVSKVCTSPYHPQSNGAVERSHQTLRRMIGKMDPEKRCKWPSHLGSVIIAYNATRSLVTGFSPYFLMFGRRPHLPIDLLFPTARRQESSRTVDEYVLSLYERLKEALPVARDSAKLEAQRQKRHYDRRARAVELQPGDKVLIKLDAFRGQKRKLKKPVERRATYRGEPCGRQCTHICCEVREDWKEAGAPPGLAITLASRIRWRASESKLSSDRFESTWNGSEDQT